MLNHDNAECGLLLKISNRAILPRLTTAVHTVLSADVMITVWPAAKECPAAKHHRVDYSYTQQCHWRMRRRCAAAIANAAAPWHVSALLAVANSHKPTKPRNGRIGQLYAASTANVQSLILFHRVRAFPTSSPETKHSITRFNHSHRHRLRRRCHRLWQNQHPKRVTTISLKMCIHHTSKQRGENEAA